MVINRFLWLAVDVMKIVLIDCFWDYERIFNGLHLGLESIVWLAFVIKMKVVMACFFFSYKDQF